MTRKDYKLVASILKDYWEADVYESVNTKVYKDGLVFAFCKALRQDNPDFDEVLFKETCGRVGL